MRHDIKFKISLITALIFAILFNENCNAENFDSSIKVSVIIPVFNTATCLEDCLDSVCRQSLKDGMEIICVNDGSTDNSANILEKYAKAGKIKVINQENKGASAARNAGLKIAVGEYVAFVDSDDTVTLNAYETSYKKAKEKNADVLMFGEKSFRIKEKTLENGFDALKIPGAMMLWNKLYKRSFLTENQFEMFEKAKCYNDECFNSIVLPKAKCTVCISDQLYTYRRKRAGSLQTSANAKRKAKNALVYANYVCDNWRKNGYVKYHGFWLFKKLIMMINRSIQKLTTPDRHYYAQALMKIASDDLYNKENTDKLNNLEKTLLNNWTINI